MPSGTNIPLSLSGSLPQNFCPSTWQEILNGFTEVIILDTTSIGSTGSAMVVSANKPTDTTVVWKRVDSQGRFLRYYVYAQGAWLSPHALLPGSSLWWFTALPNFTIFDGGDNGVSGDQSGPMWQSAQYAAAIQIVNFYSVPGTLSAVTAQVTTEQPFIAGETVIINNGSYIVNSFTTGQLNLTYHGNNTVDTTVAANTTVYGATENLVYDKFNASVMTTAQFTVPALNGSVVVSISYEVPAQNNPFSVGQNVIIGHGLYYITALGTNQLTVTYKGPVVRSQTPVFNSTGTQFHGNTPVKAVMILTAGTLASSGTVATLGMSGGEEVHHLNGTEAGVYPGHRHGLGVGSQAGGSTAPWNWYQMAYETGGLFSASAPGQAIGGSGDIDPLALADITDYDPAGGVPSTHFAQTDIPTFLPAFQSHANMPPYVVGYLLQRTDRLFYAVS